jgi:hypothetical protein
VLGRKLIQVWNERFGSPEASPRPFSSSRDHS